MSHLPRLGTFLALLLLAMTSPSMAQDKEPPRSVSVNGEGRVRAEPDLAIVRFGIVTTALDPEVARSENARASREAMNAVRALGVAERKLKLEQLVLSPAREYDEETRRYKEIGFEVSRRLVVELEDVEQLPSLIAQIVQKGANRLDGVTYDLKDRAAVEQKALAEAVRNAQVKAALMAETLGATLGEVLQVNEQGMQYPGPYRLEMTADAGMMKSEAAPEPEAYAAGELEIIARVGASFRLK